MSRFSNGFSKNKRWQQYRKSMEKGLSKWLMFSSPLTQKKNFSVCVLCYTQTLISHGVRLKAIVEKSKFFSFTYNFVFASVYAAKGIYTHRKTHEHIEWSCSLAIGTETTNKTCALHEEFFFPNNKHDDECDSHFTLIIHVHSMDFHEKKANRRVAVCVVHFDRCVCVYARRCMLLLWSILHRNYKYIHSIWRQRAPLL